MGNTDKVIKLYLSILQYYGVRKVQRTHFVKSFVRRNIQLLLVRGDLWERSAYNTLTATLKASKEVGQ